MLPVSYVATRRRSPLSTLHERAARVSSHICAHAWSFTSDGAEMSAWGALPSHASIAPFTRLSLLTDTVERTARPGLCAEPEGLLGGDSAVVAPAAMELHD